MSYSGRKMLNHANENHNPDIGRKLNSSKNKELGVLLKKFIDGEFDETEENKDMFTSLLKVIAGRLLTLNK